MLGQGGPVLRGAKDAEVRDCKGVSLHEAQAGESTVQHMAPRLRA
jgi:hypothetical protein